MESQGQIINELNAGLGIQVLKPKLGFALSRPRPQVLIEAAEAHVRGALGSKALGFDEHCRQDALIERLENSNIGHLAKLEDSASVIA